MEKPFDTEPQTTLFFQFFTEIGIISQLATAMFERNLPHDLTSSQFGVLNWFSRVDTVASPGRLATAFQVTAGAMTNTLKKLEAKGFVAIGPDANSGRSKRVTLTAAGATAREEAIASAEPMFAEFARHFDATTLTRQLGELRDIRTYLDELRFGQTDGPG